MLKGSLESGGSCAQAKERLAAQSGLPQKGRDLENHAGIEAVEGGLDGSVGGEHVARPRGPQGDREGNVVPFGIPMARARTQGPMTFVQVADLNVDPQLLQQPPTAHAQHDIL